jgi:pimeloyl-ACP methyl ester carboxylesterase
MHSHVTVGDIELHVVEQGEGDPVILCHGFPGLWYSWRHQLDALAAAGYRAIAPDMRGYGRSGGPTDPRRYDRRHTVDDLVGLLDALELEQAVFVGHDFGAQLVWDLPAWAPDRVRALVQLSVPRVPRSPVRPSDAYRYLASKHFFHMDYFQEPGRAERELDARPREFLAAIFHALSGANRYLDCWNYPAAGNGYLDVLPTPPELPWSWMTADELDVYAGEFARTGFTGGLNWYRADDATWEQNAALHSAPITVPTMFIAGSKDPVLEMMGADPFASMSALVPGLRSTHLIEGAGHFVQLEAPEQVDNLILRFLHDRDRTPI